MSLVRWGSEEKIQALEEEPLTRIWQWDVDSPSSGWPRIGLEKPQGQLGLSGFLEEGVMKEGP